jgi:hypothetical protein
VRAPTLSRSRALRITALLAILGGSLYALLNPSNEHILVNTTWKVVRRPPAETACSSTSPQQTRWTFDVVGEGFETLESELVRMLRLHCTTDCVNEIDVRAAPQWRAKPSFFSGFGRLESVLLVRRRSGDCEDEVELLLDVWVDEGVRGQPDNTRFHMARVAAVGLPDLTRLRRSPAP